MADGPAEDAGAQRIDKWLWHARFVRTRSAATSLVTAKRFRVNGRVGIKPAALVRPGDVLTFPLGRTVRVIRILKLADRRGSATIAQTLYEAVEED